MARSPRPLRVGMTRILVIRADLSRRERRCLRRARSSPLGERERRGQPPRVSSGPGARQTGRRRSGSSRTRSAFILARSVSLRDRPQTAPPLSQPIHTNTHPPTRTPHAPGAGRRPERPNEPNERCSRVRRPSDSARGPDHPRRRIAVQRGDRLPLRLGDDLRQARPAGSRDGRHSGADQRRRPTVGCCHRRGSCLGRQPVRRYRGSSRPGHGHGRLASEAQHPSRQASPVGVAAGGGSVWAADRSTEQVWRLDPTTGAVLGTAHR